jgi:hypothetical protein
VTYPLDWRSGLRRVTCRRPGLILRPDPDDKPVLPEQSEEETGIGWGEAPVPDNDERLRRDRPPHWDQ